MMMFVGKFKDLKERGFSTTYDKCSYFVAGLPKGEYLFIDVKSRTIEVSNKKYLDKLNQNEME